MKFYLTLFALLFISILSKAQSNFKPGYYINTKNDTVKGFIEQREKFNNPREFYFRATNNGSVQIIGVADAKAVGITGYNYFDKFTTTITKGYISLDRLETAVDSSYVTDTVFLRVIKEGKYVSLYAYTDNIKTRYFIVESTNDKATELKYFVFYNEQSHHQVDVNVFKQQLYALAQKYQPNHVSLNNKISESTYDEGDFSRIVQLLDGGNISLRYQTKKLETTRFFVGAGLKSNKLNFTGQNFVYPNGGSVNSISPTLSGGMDFLLNKETQKIIFRLEASVTNYKYSTGSIDVTGFSVDPSYNSLDFNQFTVTLHPQLIYNIISRDIFKFFIDAGFAMNESFYNNYATVNTTTVASTYVGVTKKNKFPAFQSGWYSVPLKVGVIVSKSVEIYAAYWTQSTLATYTYSGASVSSYQIGLNYLLGTK